MNTPGQSPVLHARAPKLSNKPGYQGVSDGSSGPVRSPAQTFRPPKARPRQEIVLRPWLGVSASNAHGLDGSSGRTGAAARMDHPSPAEDESGPQARTTQHCRKVIRPTVVTSWEEVGGLSRTRTRRSTTRPRFCVSFPGFADFRIVQMRTMVNQTRLVTLQR